MENRPLLTNFQVRKQHPEPINFVSRGPTVLKAASHTLVPIFIQPPYQIPGWGPSCHLQLPVNSHLVPETEHHPVIYGWVVPLNHPLPASQPKLGAGMQESNLIQPLKRTTDIHVHFSCSCHRWHDVIYGFMDVLHVRSIFIGRICLWHRVQKARADVCRRNVLALVQLLMSRWQIQSHVLYTAHHENGKQFSVLLSQLASFSLIFLHSRKAYRTNDFPFFCSEQKWQLC